MQPAAGTVDEARDVLCLIFGVCKCFADLVTTSRKTLAGPGCQLAQRALCTSCCSDELSAGLHQKSFLTTSPACQTCAKYLSPNFRALE